MQSSFSATISPDALRGLITGRYPLESYRDLLVGKSAGIKNVITLE